MRNVCLLGISLMVGGCGSSPSLSLKALSGKQLALAVSFDPPGAAPTVAASLSFDHAMTPCPSLEITADIDGVALESSPAGTGSTGLACQLGYYLVAPPPPALPTSTLRFSDQATVSSLTAVRLLEPRQLTAQIADGSTVHAGDQINFTWSTDSDGIDDATASFTAATSGVVVTPQVSGTIVGITVPSLGPGSWKLSIGVLAHAAITDCTGASSCTTQIARGAALTLTVD